MKKNALPLHLAAFVLIRTVMNTAIRMVYPYLPVFEKGLGVDLVLLSRSLTIRSATGVVGPFLAALVAARGVKFGMLSGLGLYTAGMGAMAVRPSFPAFLAALVLTLVGNFIFIPSMQTYLANRVSYRRRGLAFSLTEFGWALSFIIGVPLIGLLIARFGWRSTFPVLTVLGLLSIAVIAWLLPPVSKDERIQSNAWGDLRSALTSPTVLVGLLFGFLLNFANEMVNLVFGFWMQDAFGLQISALGATALVIGLSELGGEGLVAALADRIGKTRATTAGLALNALAALGLPVLGVTVPGAMVGLFLFYITFEFTLVASLPVMSEVFPGARAAVMASYVGSLSLGRSLGALLSPRMYAMGIGGNAGAAAVLDLIALTAFLILARRMGKMQAQVRES